jgi:hypothetical protein
MITNLPVSKNVSDYLTQLEHVVDQLAARISVGGTDLSKVYSSRPIPSIEGVEIPFKKDDWTDPALKNDYTRLSGNIIIAPDATFLARAIHFGVRFTSQISYGVLGHPELQGNWSTGLYFYWEYEVTGSKRKRMNIPVPCNVSYDADAGHGFFEFFVEDVFSPGSIVTIWITRIGQQLIPQQHEPLDGILWAGFSGTYVVD